MSANSFNFAPHQSLPDGRPFLSNGVSREYRAKGVFLRRLLSGRSRVSARYVLSAECHGMNVFVCIACGTMTHFYARGSIERRASRPVAHSFSRFSSRRRLILFFSEVLSWRIIVTSYKVDNIIKGFARINSVGYWRRIIALLLGLILLNLRLN